MHDYKQIISERLGRLKKIQDDKSILTGLKAHYKYNVIDFINDWGWTHDPRRKTLKIVPWILWEKQEEYLLWLNERMNLNKDGVARKCRDAGVTWLDCGWSVHRWLFYSGFKAGFGSRKEALVDRLGDPDSIFEKMRIFLRNLPVEFLPEGFNIEKHASFLKIKNPENDSVIAGEAGDNIGRGGRSSIYFKDESAFYERPLKIDAALSHNSDVKIDVSTHNGLGTLFYQKCTNGKYDIFDFDWHDDPRKTQEWYDTKKELEDPVIFAQEVDKDPGASAEGIAIPAKWVQAAVNFNIPAEGEKVSGLDVADEGGDANAQAFRHGSVITKEIKAWMEGTPVETARKAYFACIQSGYQKLKYDNIGIGVGVRDELVRKEYKDLTAEGFSSAGSPTTGWYINPDPENQIAGKRNKDAFLNLRAQAWWGVRRRFEKTYQHRNGVQQYKHDEMISIPSDVETIAELSMPKYEFTDNGKIKIESKKKMKTRGVKSPNKADAVIYAFAPIQNKGPFFKISSV